MGEPLPEGKTIQRELESNGDKQLLFEWITTGQLAALAGIDERTARTAAADCLAGKTWKSTAMKVIREGKPLMIYGPSLPEYLRDIWHKAYEEGTRVKAPAAVALPSPATYSEKVVESYRWQQWRLDLIAPALKEPKYSEERGNALGALVGKQFTKPNGRIFCPSLATLQGWVKRFEEVGEQALTRKARKEQDPRVLVNRRWDKESPFPPEQKAEIAEEIGLEVRSLWASKAPGWARVNQLASVKLFSLCRDAGWNEATPENCQLGRSFVEKWREFGLIAIKETNAKLFSDRYVPHIHRTRKDLKPGDDVVADVHPLDVQRLVDGRIVHARLIAWLDLATYDLFATLVILPPGKGIRQEDVAASFVDMVQAWGLPKRLRIDHGSEFNWAAMLRGFETLAALVKAFTDFSTSLLGKGEAGEMIDDDQFKPRHAVSKARPYNARAKQIEGVFGILERYFFSMMPGWIAGDRTNKRTHNVGKAPRPYDGEDEEFERDFAICLDLYRNTPQKDGSSPNDKRRAAYAAGFRPVTISRPDLMFAFSELHTCTVHPGGIKVEGAWYRADVLIPLVTKRVDIRVAKWDLSHVFYVDKDDHLHAIPPVHKFDQDDLAGAKEQGRMAGVMNLHIRQLKAATRPVDLLIAAAAVNDASPPAPELPEGIAISTAEGTAIAAAIGNASAPAVRKRLPGQIQDPKTGAILTLHHPPKDEGPKPTAIDFDPLSFSPPTPETKGQPLDEQEFDLIQALTARHHANEKDAT